MTCIVRPNGSIDCPKMEFITETADESVRTAFQSGVEGYFRSEWCDQKFDLALRILRRLHEAPINCDRIALRADKIVSSVYFHLEEEPESMLLFNYNTLPADSLGAWVHAKNGFEAVRELHRRFDGRDPK